MTLKLQERSWSSSVCTLAGTLLRLGWLVGVGGTFEMERLLLLEAASCDILRTPDLLVCHETFQMAYSTAKMSLTLMRLLTSSEVSWSSGLLKLWNCGINISEFFRISIAFSKVGAKKLGPLSLMAIKMLITFNICIRVTILHRLSVTLVIGASMSETELNLARLGLRTKSYIKA